MLRKGKHIYLMGTRLVLRLHSNTTLIAAHISKESKIQNYIREGDKNAIKKPYLIYKENSK